MNNEVEKALARINAERKGMEDAKKVFSHQEAS